MRKISLLIISFILLQGLATIQAADCYSTVIPDLPLEPSNATIEAEINSIFNKYSDNILGTSAPSASALSSAVTKYNNLNIVVSNGVITGNAVSSFEDVDFIKTFAQQLKFNPSDDVTMDRANKLVWWVSQQYCNGTLKNNVYTVRSFARPAVCLDKFLTPQVKGLFLYLMSKEAGMGRFWSRTYDADYQLANGVYSTDLIYILSDAIMACVSFETTPEGRYRYMRGFQRFMNRFLSYTVKTLDGLKMDGTGFHHNAAYDPYMYAYSTAAFVTTCLSGSSFQISKDSYLFLRNAVYAQIIYTNNSNIKALSMSGRHPQSRSSTLASSTVSRLAIVGGQILGLTTADPVLAGEYIRLWGQNTSFNYTVVAPLSQSSGFYQFNHANAGVFRKESSWLAVAKGFSDKLWGAETYPTSNRYGRYQSYGALEIIYPGNATANGYDVNTWNWNFNPGTTTIVLPWAELHAERDRLDEFQSKDFAGALAFKNKNSEALSKTHGTYGLFAMDFQQRTGLGWGTVFGPDTHNSTFTFKKSYFFFDDIIVCLGSNINNNDANNQTVTTLSQHLGTTGTLFLNGTSKRTTDSIQCTTDNWVLSSFNTGFYIVANSNNYLNFFVGDQHSPHYASTNPSSYINNAVSPYKTMYINHKKSPSNASYEYVTIPNASTTSMAALNANYTTNGKPYIVRQKNANAHIVEHNSGIWGYTVFVANSTIDTSGLIRNVNFPSLIMYEQDNVNNKLLIALTNPSIGFSAGTYLSYKPIAVTLKGSWEIEGENPNVLAIKNGTSTVVTFQTKDGLPEEVTLINNDLTAGVALSKANNYEVFPNPVSGFFSMNGSFPENSDWKLTNLLGQKMKYGKVLPNHTKIDVSELMSAVYLMYVYSGKALLYTSKVIVKR